MAGQGVTVDVCKVLSVFLFFVTVFFCFVFLLFFFLRMEAMGFADGLGICLR